MIRAVLIATASVLGIGYGLDRLYPVPTQCVVSSFVTPGESGRDVLTIQKRLNRFGVWVFEDGEYGPDTETAVISFQAWKHLDRTGQVDTATATALGCTIGAK